MSSPLPSAVAATWEHALVAELCWLDGDEPAALPVVPLTLDGAPCAAVAFDRADEVATLLDGADATFTVTDPRGVGDGAVVAGTVRVRDDLDGEEFTARLLEQELVRHPPSRLRADSLVQRREHWWWLPRRLVVLDRVVAAAPMRRRGDGGAVLVTGGAGGGAEVASVRVTGSAEVEPGELAVARDDGAPVRGAAEPALLLGHRYAVPDLDPWTSWRRSGTLRGDRLEVTAGSGEAGGAERRRTLRDRLREERDTARRCRRGIAAAEAAVRR